MGLSKKQRKTVTELRCRVDVCREFLNDWMLFNQILVRYPEPGINKAELETQFLKIKSKIARTHRVLKDMLTEDYNIDGNAMNIVSGATSLEAIYSQSEVAVKKLQNEWHRAFISINETLGTIDEKLSRAEAGEKVHVAPRGGAGASPTKKDPTESLQKVAKILAILGAIVAAAVGIMYQLGRL